MWNICGIVWTGEAEVLGENTAPVPLRPPPETTWISLGWNQVLWGEKPASNQAQYGGSNNLHTWFQKVHVMGSAFSAPRGRIFISYCLLWLAAVSPKPMSPSRKLPRLSSDVPRSVLSQCRTKFPYAMVWQVFRALNRDRLNICECKVN